MQAIRISETGRPDVLRLEDVPTPHPGPGQALVKLEAAGVNFIEIYQRLGQYKMPLPFTPGGEGAGVVEAVGAGVTDVQTGDRVAAVALAGAYAQYALAAAEQLVIVPPSIDLRTAAAVMLQGMTAHYLSHSTYPLKAGDTALVYAAAGGVGRLLTQIAKKRGARVLACVSTAEKATLAKSAGADEIIMYTQQQIADEARRLTNGAGVDVVYDSVGKDTFEQSLDSLKPRGYLVLYGQSSGPVAPMNPQTLNAKGSLFLTRPTLAHYIATRDELLTRANDLFGWITSGELDVRIDKTWPLAGAAQAQEYLAGRKSQGKLLLLP
ncbi:MAG: quinone oxidoreductase [Ktedonobacterales bacterium]